MRGFSVRRTVSIKEKRVETRKLRVWDLPTRLFHWVLVLLVIGSIVSINVGGNWVEWHFRFGYAILALLLFRIVWGLVGGYYARFCSFPPNPLAALRYVRTPAIPGSHAPGHSPLAALAVYALLAALLFQVCTGLFANDAIISQGPLARFVSNETSDLLTSLHKINRLILIGLIVLHLLAQVYYALRRRINLVKPMITGDMSVALTSDARPANDGWTVRLLGAVILLLSAGVVYGLVSWGLAGSGF